mgnify:CR=1 FL=1
MPRRLQLRRYELQNVNYQWLGAFRLRVEALPEPTSDPPMDTNVFIYRRDPVNPYTGTQTDTFFAVASPVDMSEYPVGAPSATTRFPFFRLNYVELDFRSSAQAEEAWRIIVHDVDNLLKALDRMDQLVPTTTITVGS